MPVPASTIDFAAAAEIRSDDIVLDLGCGAGYLALDASRRGAREVWATDIDPACVAQTEANARAEGLAVRTTCGDLFDPVRGKRFTVVLANPPQTPFPPGVEHPKSGGPRGLRFFERLSREARPFLVPRGRLYLMCLSLVPEKEFLALFEPDFVVVRLGETRREVSRAEYDAIHPGLWEYLSQFELCDGYFLNRFYRAQPRS